MQTEREARTMKAKSLGHLSMNAISKLYNGGIYDTKKYRYIGDRATARYTASKRTS